MKNVKTLLIGGSIFFAQLGFSQTGKICNWKDDKKAAVVLTFDDWSPGHYPVAVPELNSRNINATFFVTINQVNGGSYKWPAVNTTASVGHEIGNHTVSHADLPTKTSAQLNTEITGARNSIQSNVPSQKVVSFAYPLGTGTGSSAKDIEVRDTIKASGHIGARSVNPPSGQYYTYNFAPTVDDYYKIKTYVMGGSISTNAYATQIHNTIAGGGLLVYLYHSVDDLANSHGDNWYAKVLQDSLQKQLDTLVSLQDKIWVTTFGRSLKYHRERKCATLTEVQASNGTLWIVNLTDTLTNNSIYNEPLTLKLKMNGVAYDHVTQNGNALTFAITGDTIQFEAVPDAGQISLSVGSTPTNELPTLDALTNVSINQTDGTQTINLTGISAGASESQTLTVTASTYHTALIKNLSVNYTSPNPTGSISFNPSPTTSGVTTIVVRVTDNGTPASYIERSFTVSIAAAATGLREVVASNTILTLSPNPTSDLITIHTERQFSEAKISLEDLSGRIIYEKSFSSTDHMQLDLSDKKEGMYLLKIKTGEEILTRKVVVQR